jgi:cell division protein FtsB
MVVGDSDVVAAVGVIGSAILGGLSWFAKTLWSSRDAAQAQVVELLKLQYADAANRKDLWDKLTLSNDNLTREIRDLEKTISEMQRTINDLREQLARKVT